MPYAGFERVRRRATAHHGQLLAQEFGADVRITVRVPVEHFEAFRNSVQNAFNGSIRIDIQETDPNTLMPLE